jgi:hypothetical protein
MSLDPVTALLDIGGKVIDRIWPDPTQAANAKFELFKLQQSGELATIAGQLKINEVEAANPNVFVSGWRPFVGWVCGFGLVYSFIGQPLLAWGSVNWHFAIPPVLDLGSLLTILGGMLGLSGLRTFEKINGVNRK